MSYTALARTWRPKKFSELIGQEHVRRALVNALESGRVHHAFLFTGTRGVGKTTIARILAKCLNCERGVTAEPCGECASCREIDAGRFPDLIEVDAASRTKVDDTRELLDNVQYAPARGRYKVYLIDEVHMLSAHSFNALLKTLEEPPPHVKFLLATTDPQKLPVTVLSRCLHYNLKGLPVADIAAHMRRILEQEGVGFDAAGLKLVAQAADGSMRDALSLLDQLIAFGAGKAGESEARAMLGTISRDHVVRILELLAAADTAALVRCAHSLEEFAPDYAQVLDELAALLVRIGLKQALSDYEGDELYAPELLERLARCPRPEDVQLFYQTAIMGKRDLGLAPEPRTGFEMTLLRMIAFRPAGELPSGSRPSAADRARRSAATAPRAEQRAAGSAAGAGGGCRGRERPRRGSLGDHRERAGALGRGAPARQPLRVHRPPRRSRASGARCAQPAGAHAGAGGKVGPGTVALLRRAGAARVSGRRCARRDPGASRTARLRAGAGCRAARLRGRPGRAGPARALRRDRAARHRASGKMTPDPIPARSA